MNRKSNRLMLACFIGFYMLLFGAGVYVFVMGIVKEDIGIAQMFLGAKYNMYFYLMTFISLAAFMVLFPITLGRVLALGVDRSYKMLVITAGVTLIPSFLHGEGTFVILNYIGRKVNTFSDTSCGVYVSYRAFGVKAGCLNFLPFYIVPSAKTNPPIDNAAHPNTSFTISGLL